ncbi:alpha/beta hydrolase [Testudinibacter sp. TR-2022]|uniref:alpha/beta hydrolase n=1 Tax=Testudinibacter sp. TR-2022 TaxID=2585029 RepID=UPI0011188B4B|nr:alpha/beta hydrolase [Testudinibacter sp. TR-2022]TNH06801.1 alpha/beta hydrolase [Pasteurellaceae bacterium Phil11]TNH24131.1 alpha/beta hydrolase [Testudinibacter sp. TR-2022]TNH27600.1 alpha/beta hydrolase [Testudinibacter sp. TR-2022]
MKRNTTFKKLTTALILSTSLLGATAMATPQNTGIAYPTGYANWYQSHNVNIQKVKFNNPYGIEIVGNLVLPKNYKQGEKLQAIIIGHPMGAVKEQASMLYAQVLAEHGFATLAIDMPFWGESGGTPRQAVEPTMFEDAFSSAVDYLGSRPEIDKNKIGVLGICASGGYSISAMKIDPRIKALATSAMVEMGTASRTMMIDEAAVKAGVAQREVEFAGGKPAYTGGTTTELTADTNPMQREFYGFYRTARGEYTPKGADPKTTTMPLLSHNPKLLNFYPFNGMETIKRPMLFITGDVSMSRNFSEEAYKLASEPKELYWVAGANHTDMYDNADKIPFAKLVEFFGENLK